MIWETSFKIEYWSAWAPGLEDLSSWESWCCEPGEICDNHKPAAKFVAASLRRRCGQATRMQLQTAFNCLGAYGWTSEIETVFASRHGECVNSQALLAMLAGDEILSPMCFSLSVHNTASGIFSIAAGNKSFTTAVSANKWSFSAALLEALVRIRSGGSSEVLLCMAEECIPEFLAESVEEYRMPYGLSLILSGAGRDDGISLRLRGNGGEPDQPLFSQGLGFVQWLLSDKRELFLRDPRLTWELKKTDQSLGGAFVGAA